LSRTEEVRRSSDRSFGLTVGGIVVLIAAARAAFHGFGWLETALAAIGAVLVLLALAAPSLLAPLNGAWMRLGLVLSKVVNPIVMCLLYVTTIVPMGLVMRALGRDQLRIRFDPNADSYWIKREPPGPAPDTMTNQF
jgi:hypothetical protein